MILVDELRAMPNARPPLHHVFVARLTTSNVGLDDLHAFAELLGVPRWMFESSPRPHYIITKTKRTLALRMGATFIPAARQAAYRMGACSLETMLGMPALAKTAVVIPIGSARRVRK